MGYDFETVVKKNRANLSESTMDPEIRRAGNISFDGAKRLSYRPVIRMLKYGWRRTQFRFYNMDQRYRTPKLVMQNVRGFGIGRDWIVRTSYDIFACYDKKAYDAARGKHNRYYPGLLSI